MLLLLSSSGQPQMSCLWPVERAAAAVLVLTGLFGEDSSEKIFKLSAVPCLECPYGTRTKDVTAITATNADQFFYDTTSKGFYSRCANAQYAGPSTPANQRQCSC
jgi:hypothetical protein